MTNTFRSAVSLSSSAPATALFLLLVPGAARAATETTATATVLGPSFVSELGLYMAVLALALVVALAASVISKLKTDKRFSEMFNNAPIGIFHSTTKGVLTKANNELSKMLGYDFPDESPSFIWDMGREKHDNPGGKTRFIQRMEEYGRVNNMEIQAKCKDGSRKWISVSAKKTCDSSGSCHYEGFVTDISARKKTEKRLEKNRLLLDKTGALGKIGGWELDIATGKGSWTAEMFKIMENDSGVPLNWGEYLNSYPPKEAAFVQEALDRAVESGEPFDLTLQAYTTKARPIWCRVLGQAEYVDGKCRKLFGILQDISRQKETETALTEKELQFQAILEAVQAGILIVDSKTRTIENLNNFAQEMLGTSKRKVVGKICHSHICPTKQGNCPILDHGREERGTERILITAKGKSIPVLKSAVPIRLGGRDMLLESFVDISRLKEVEASLVRAKEAAEASNKSKGEFLANMSHEIRTPLNGVFGMLQLLQTTNLNSIQTEYVQTAMDSSSSLLSVINDILDFSIIEANALKIVEEKFLIREMLQSLTANFSFQAQKKGLNLACEVAPDVPKSVVGDAARIRQVLFNLVGNSLKFTKKGDIKIELSRLPDRRPGNSIRLLFCVSDSGVGIPDSLLPTLFDPFAQADEVQSRRFKGSGLGLGIVKRLVNLMNGAISIESEKGKGTAIHFTIKVKEDLDSKSKKRKPTAVPTIDYKLHVLLAEDDATNRTVAARMLEKAGHSVTCVSTGKQAVRLMEGNTFDCILMDVQMPEMDGLEATKIIRSGNGADTPIIALTAHAMKGDKERFLAAGMDGYLAKPVEQGALLKTLSEALASRKTEAKKN